MEITKYIFIIFVITASVLYAGNNNENFKGVKVVDEDRPAASTDSAGISLNSAQTFSNVKENNIVALLIGNDKYSIESKMPQLRQCANDVKLLSKILRVCCKVPSDNIIQLVDITADEFRKKFIEAVHKLNEKQGFFLGYSGHGDRDGSLIFTDGGRVTPDELKQLVNSFSNDTTILLDACYSGNNEGPVDIREDIKFKNNSLRIYASLAHLQAKEILYNNDYFNRITPFYENVLGLKDLYGNGYFTSFVGYAFAEYQFQKNENLSFRDLVGYMANKGKQYTEYLAMKGSKSRNAGLFEESGLRLIQQPKIFPLEKKVEYDDPNHEFLLINKYIQPIGFNQEVILSPFYCAGIKSDTNSTRAFKGNISGAYGLRLTYGPPVLKGLFTGIEAGYLSVERKEDKSENLQGITLNMIPVLGLIGYKINFAKNKFYFRTDVGAGVSVNIWDFKQYEVVQEKIYRNYDFAFQGGLGTGYFIYRNVSISINIQVFGFRFDGDNIFYGYKLPLIIGYQF